MINDLPDDHDSIELRELREIIAKMCKWLTIADGIFYSIAMYGILCIHW